MKNIHLVPTEKPSRLVKLEMFGKDKLHLCKVVLPIEDEEQYQNIYITSDEEIKEGNWSFNEYQKTILRFNAGVGIGLCKKIILTTDQDLIKDGVQAIDDEFLEWFVKNPSCEEVETIYGLFNPMGRQVDPMNLGQNHSQCVWKYKIIIPQEESKQDYSKVHLRHCYQGEYEDTCKYGEDDCPAKPLEELKQKTLEEAAEKYRKHWVNNTNSTISDTFMAGAKWQAERMYSEEDLRKAIDLARETLEYDEQHGWYSTMSEDEIIQSLKNPKIPKKE